MAQVTGKCGLEQRGGGRRGAGRLEEVVLHGEGGQLAARPRLLHLSRLPHESLHCRVGRRHATKEGKCTFTRLRNRRDERMTSSIIRSSSRELII